MIEVKNLVKKYGSHTAVDHLSFQVEPGKIYGFLGPNGAGKSTTMNIMTGYIAATEGSVKINGYDIVKDAEDAKRCIGYLPEIPPLYQDMTVEEYLLFVAGLKKIPKPERKTQIAEVMELTMVAEVSGRLIRNLSKGYKQRVGLAQAVLGYPEVIILDEPTVGLDPKQIIEIRDLIKKLGEKHTVILSSHILSEVQAVCDEIMILSKGRLAASGTPEQLTGLMNGSTRIEMSILGEREQVEPLIKGFDRVKEYHFENESEENCVKLILETEVKDDIREALFYTLAENRLPIMAMNRLEKSLEDIFLELTEAETEEREAEGGIWR
ncbi:MAG: ABC transporter ATP-binding protein [Clostridium sp.]|nr:ABC transporter ATP-binding protein [Clostridium sp.]